MSRRRMCIDSGGAMCGHRPLRKDRRVHPHIRRRGRRPAVERSGTNALGVRRPVSAAVPRCEAPSGRGLSAQPTGGEKTVWNLSLRQRFALPPPSQREARRAGFPRQCSHWLRMTALRAVWADEVVHPYKLPPPALRAATSLAEGGTGDPHLLARRDTWVPPYGH